jgi:(p)ppGpp synthase/HD superfamily hydrolase
MAEQMKDEATTCVALLHDVVEDTDITFDQLTEYGFPDEIILALRYLTHDKQVPYMDYIEKIKENPIAKAVKLEDLRHNSDLSRYEELEDWMTKRNEKYIAAIESLS